MATGLASDQSTYGRSLVWSVAIWRFEPAASEAGNAMSMKELLERKGELAAEMKKLGDIANEKDDDGNRRGWTAEQDEKWDKLGNDYDELLEQIEAEERSAAIDARLKQIDDDAKNPDPNRRGLPGRHDTRHDPEDDQITEQTRSLALQGWCRAQMDEQPTEDQAEACKRVGLNPYAKQLRFDLLSSDQVSHAQEGMRDVHHSMWPRVARSLIEESRDLSHITGASGAATIPEGFVNSLEVNLLAFGGMMAASTLLRTATGNDLPYPTVDDTSNSGEILSENTSIGSSTDPTFGAITFHAYKYSSKPVLVPSELLEDSAFNLPVFLSNALATRIARILNQHTTTGTGNGQPHGITLASTLGKTTAAAAAIAADEIIDLQDSIDPAYEQGASWMFHKNIRTAIRKLKTSDGEYLWQPGLQAGVPDTLLGGTIIINQDMASSVATGNITMLYGQLSKYTIRHARAVRMFRLQERYRDTDQDGFVMFTSYDGNLIDAGTAPVKYMQQA